MDEPVAVEQFLIHERMLFFDKLFNGFDRCEVNGYAQRFAVGCSDFFELDVERLPFGTGEFSREDKKIKIVVWKPAIVFSDEDTAFTASISATKINRNTIRSCQLADVILQLAERV